MIKTNRVDECESPFTGRKSSETAIVVCHIKKGINPVNGDAKKPQVNLRTRPIVARPSEPLEVHSNLASLSSRDCLTARHRVVVVAFRLSTS